MDLFQGLEMPTELAHFSVQLAMVRRHHGELDEAQRLLEEASGLAQTIGDDFTAAWAQQELGALFLDRGDLAQARPRLERALALRRARGLRAFFIETELGLARLALLEGTLEEAAPLVERALAFYVEQQNRDKEGLTHALFAQLLLMSGDSEQARQALTQALVPAGRSEDVFIEAEVLLTVAWAEVRLGTPSEREEAARRLQELVARTREGGLKGLEFQARCGLAELGGADVTEQAPAECLALEQEATRLGYLDIARRASAVARRSSGVPSSPQRTRT